MHPISSVETFQDLNFFKLKDMPYVQSRKMRSEGRGGQTPACLGLRGGTVKNLPGEQDSVGKTKSVLNGESTGQVDTVEATNTVLGSFSLCVSGLHKCEVSVSSRFLLLERWVDRRHAANSGKGSELDIKCSEPILRREWNICIYTCIYKLIWAVQGRVELDKFWELSNRFLESPEHGSRAVCRQDWAGIFHV